jgi:hypothetical protein
MPKIFQSHFAPFPPSLCPQKPYVLRAYDTRVRSTYRSPFLYKNYCHLRSQTMEVLRVEDEGIGEIQEFGLGFNGQCTDGKKNSTPFCDAKVDRKGAVDVIAVPFHEGSHVCTNIDQAIAVAKDLKRLHDAGFVHGDIRAMNIVFSSSNPEESCLIDFDFGGEDGKNVYPDGYQFLLVDGHRLGSYGDPIEKLSDVYALWYVLYRCHQLDETAEDEADLLFCKQSKKRPVNIEKLLDRLKDLKSSGATSMMTGGCYSEMLAGCKKSPAPTQATAMKFVHKKTTPDGAQVSPTSNVVHHTKLLKNNKRKVREGLTESRRNYGNDENVLDRKAPP